MKAGSKVEFGDLEIGMKVRCHRTSFDVYTEGVITRLSNHHPAPVVESGTYCLSGGAESDTFTLLEDFNEPKLPEREGMVVASFDEAVGFAFRKIAGTNVTGMWRQHRDTKAWGFVPFGSIATISAQRITAITEVTAVPDDALELLANLQRELTSGTYARDVLDEFFRRANGVQG